MANRVLAFVRREKYFLFEAYLLVRLIGIGVYMFTVRLLVQDKVCFNLHRKPIEFCQHINEREHDHLDGLARDNILAESAEFMNYRNLIQAIPMFLWSLFVGSFLDKYRGATKLLFLISNLIDHIDLVFFMANSFFFDLSPYYLLIAAGLTFFTGGMITFFTASNRYIILNSTEKQRPIKFVLFHFIIFVAFALGTYIGGHTLWIIESDDQGPQLRSYNTSFCISSGFIMLSTVILFILKWEPLRQDESVDEPAPNANGKSVDIEISQPNTSASTEFSNNGSVRTVIEDNNNLDISRNSTLATGSEMENQSYEKNKIERDKSKQGWLAILLDYDNIRDTFACLLRPRAKHERTQLFLLTSIILIFFFVSFGIDAIFLQFTEKAYHWDAKRYSSVTAAGNLILNVIMLLLSWILLNKLKISEYTLLIFCLPFGILAYLLMGFILDPVIYLVSVPINAITGLSSIVAKNILSKIIATDEIGKIFSITSAMEAIVPFFGSLVFTNIFAATVSTQPGMIFHACAVSFLIAFFIAIAIKYVSNK